ncbi:zinc-dependent metalloprotease [Aureisphaera galaxeae]|uniref:zinc-dependent metalloprotease n=1 Tax=Aureisphaera galaxeae TaxID=1538023 RepID=UPI002350E9EE|nr:zinc-dependent metalloprotease [Aureisphaera galaxeae]MDC8003839.1 zinc-dependent metalloprotease [Aureisphaera galaxeae]
MIKRILLGILFLSVYTASGQFLEGKKQLESFMGFFTFHYAEDEGSIYLEVPKEKLDKEFLYVHSLRTGLGSNDIGLDRGQLGGEAVVKFVKAGNKLLLMQPNLRYRAISENELERKSVSEAFAKSVLFGFPIKETKDNKHIIDLTPFLMEDVHGVANRLKRQKEGAYKLEKSRSAIWMERTKAFPKNCEFEALLTYKGQATGRNLSTVAPDNSTISVVQHHSFVELPDDGYVPREFDTRSGSYPLSYLDYSTPIWEPIKKRFITRHRLEKKDPNAAVSEAKEPIIYYLDPGTPEPIRSALIEGASWWNQAFEAIGYKDAFQVKLLPADADPMDVRYNVIQWVHRSTRGWSYGGGVTDPRTGEIIKGHVSLGSLRIRQDFMIAQALMKEPFKASDANHEMLLEMALARIRQLSAHEVGHTLGFAHNFAASANDRASVMDYPHPHLEFKNGQMDFSNAYDTGIGEWDKVTVAYSYSDAPSGVDEKVHLNAILEGAFAKGLRYITDSDARAQSGAHGTAHLWDNGTDASEELERVLSVRKTAIDNFSKENIRTGEPYTVLEDVFVPLYFFHRYQTEATVKVIGGMEYDYLVKGYNGTATNYLSKKKQKKALNAVLNTLDTETLMVPEDKLALFPPRAFGYPRDRESFKSKTGVAFDALGAAATGSKMTLQLLLNAHRANRLIQQKAMDKNNLGLPEVQDALVEKVFGKERDGYVGEVQKTIQHTTLQYLMNLAAHSQSTAQVKAITMKTLKDLSMDLGKEGNDYTAHLKKEIDNFIKEPSKFKVFAVPTIPDGSPIGSWQCHWTGEENIWSVGEKP